MSLWHRICTNIPKSEIYIKPEEWRPKSDTVQLNFTYCYDELNLKLNTRTMECVYYFNGHYHYGNMLHPTFFTNITKILDLYFTPYDFI